MYVYVCVCMKVCMYVCMYTDNNYIFNLPSSPHIASSLLVPFPPPLRTAPHLLISSDFGRIPNKARSTLQIDLVHIVRIIHQPKQKKGHHLHAQHVTCISCLVTAGENHMINHMTS